MKRPPQYLLSGLLVALALGIWRYFQRKKEIRVGDFYEDCGYHPCLCLEATEDNLEGISLVSGHIRGCHPQACAPRKITHKEAINLKLNGPSEEKKKHVAALNEQGWDFDVWW